MNNKDPLLERITQHNNQLEKLHKELAEAVSSARLAGATWQQIGTALGVSKQAASQRFQDSTSIYREKALDQIQTELNQIAEELFTALAHKDIERVHLLMTYTTARLLFKRKISKVWDSILETCGTFIELQKSIIEHSGNQYVLTYRLRHQLGQPVGQISFNSRKKITGLVIYSDDSAQLPW